jgi:hypothetical protein
LTKVHPRSPYNLDPGHLELHLEGHLDQAIVVLALAALQSPITIKQPGRTLTAQVEG